MKYLHAKVFTAFSVLTGLMSPLFAFAQNTGNSCSNSMNNLGEVFGYLTCLLSRSVIPLIVTLALVVFMFGVVQYILNGDDETKRKEGRKFMLWGIISLFVMLGIFGILQLLGNTFGIGTGGSISDITPQF